MFVGFAIGFRRFSIGFIGFDKFSFVVRRFSIGFIGFAKFSLGIRRFSTGFYTFYIVLSVSIGLIICTICVGLYVLIVVV